MAYLSPEAAKQLRAALRVGAAGIELGGSIFVGVLVGYWLDRRFGTAPWLALTGLLLGSVVGFRALIWMLRTKPQSSSSSDDSHDPKTHV